MSREPGPTMFPGPESMRPTIRGTNGLVVAGHPLAAQAASEVLAQGGNAVDAGVAAGLVLAVVHGDMCSLGGIAPMLVAEPEPFRVWSVAGVGRWSATVSIDSYRRRHGASVEAGCGPTVVPAAIAAYCNALERFGTWSFAAVVEPARKFAADGFVVDAVVAAGLRVFGRDFSQWSSSTEVFWPQNRPPEVGEVLRQPALADVLAELSAATSAKEARRCFYEGRIASAMVEFVTAEGGFLTKEDLASFDAEIELAPSRRYRGQLVATTPAWSQGPMLGQILALLERGNSAQLAHNGADYLHLLAEAVKLAAADREAFYGGADVPIDWLLSDERADELFTRFDPDTALPNLSTIRPEQLGTTHFTVIDATGRVCTASPSDTANMAPVVPDLGFIVSPRGVQSRLDPNHCAAIGPRTRPRVTPMAAIAHADDGTITALACPGADVIVQAILQVALNIWDFGLTPQAAVEAPRICSLAFPASFAPHAEIERQLCVESRILESTRRDLERRGHRVQDWAAFEFDAGSVSVVQHHPDRTLSAGADPRRAAYAAGR